MSFKFGEFKETEGFDISDEFGEFDEHFFDEHFFDDASTTSFEGEDEGFGFNFDELPAVDFTLEESGYHTNIDNGVCGSTVTTVQDCFSAFDFGDEELSSLIKKASTLFSRSDVEKVAGILDMQPVNDLKEKEYSI